MKTYKKKDQALTVFMSKSKFAHLGCSVALIALVSATPALAQTAQTTPTAQSAAPATPASGAQIAAPALATATLDAQNGDTSAGDTQENGDITVDGAVQEDSDPDPQTDEANDDDAIIVVGRSSAGSLATETPAEQVLDSETIQGYGASSIDELLDATASLTQSGRGSGRPVVLVNGRRVSSFREIRNIPPEAIDKMEVYPEEVAVSQGYKPDQRVVNFILKKNFRAITVEAEYGQPTAGGFSAQELEASLLRIESNGRTNITGEVKRETPLWESDRDIAYRTDPTLALPPGTTPADFNTLRSKTLEAKLEGTLQRYLTDDISGSLNLAYELSNSKGANGPTGYWAGDSTLCANSSALLCDGQIDTENRTRTFHAGTGFNGDIGRWRWNFSANHDRTNTTSLVDQCVLEEGTDGLNRCATVDAEQDVSKGQDVSTDATAVFNGPLFDLPAGRVRASVTTGFVARDYEGWSNRRGEFSSTDLKRQEGNVLASLEIPIADADSDVLPFLGRLSLNANAGYNHVSDFGGLTSWGTGINWSPSDRLNLSASIAIDENAPSMSQLGSPIVNNPNRTVYDFQTGQTVLVNSISGGNPDLLSQKKREWKLALNYNMPWVDNLRFSANYYNNHMDNPIGSLPLLTPEIEAAFPDRIIRDANGTLIEIDNRPLNYDSRDNSNIRYGFTFFKSFGQQERGRGEGRGEGRGGRGQGGGMRGGGEGGPPPGANAGANAGGRGGGGGRGGMGPGGGSGGRWNLSLFHTIRLTDTIDMGPGLPTLDLLDGSATGSSGGTARHQLDLDAGWFYKGFGLRGNAKYQSATTAEGDSINDQLRFGELLTFNLSAFMNFDQRPKMVEAVPFLKGSRLRLSINNVTNAIQSVRNREGEVPLTYQPGYLDPRGRYVEISFRKMF